jgi:hypothetical protein
LDHELLLAAARSVLTVFFGGSAFCLCVILQGNALGRGPLVLHLPMRLLATIKQRAAAALPPAAAAAAATQLEGYGPAYFSDTGGSTVGSVEPSSMNAAAFAQLLLDMHRQAGVMLLDRMGEGVVQHMAAHVELAVQVGVCTAVVLQLQCCYSAGHDGSWCGAAHGCRGAVARLSDLLCVCIAVALLLNSCFAAGQSAGKQTLNCYMCIHATNAVDSFFQLSSLCCWRAAAMLLLLMLLLLPCRPSLTMPLSCRPARRMPGCSGC